MGFVRLDFVEGRSGSAPYPLLGEWYKQSTTRRRYGTHQVAIGLVASEAVNPEGGTVSSEDRGSDTRRTKFEIAINSPVCLAMQKSPAE